MIEPKDLKVDVINKPMGEVVVYPRKFFVKIEHIPTGITVSKIATSQLKAKEKCIQELEELVTEYND